MFPSVQTIMGIAKAPDTVGEVLIVNSGDGHRWLIFFLAFPLALLNMAQDTV